MVHQQKEDVNQLVINPRFVCVHYLCKPTHNAFILKSQSKQNYNGTSQTKRKYHTRSSSQIKVTSTDTINLLSDSDNEDIDIYELKSKKWIFPAQHGQKKKVITMDMRAINDLKEGNEINDDIIDFGMYFNYNLWSKDLKKQCYMLPTQFWSYLKDKKNGFIHAKKCYKSIGNDILNRKYIIFPKGSCKHWELVIICNINNNNNMSPCIIILDSMNTGTINHINDFKMIRNWLNYVDDTKYYKSSSCKGYCPQLVTQQNGTDCGIFMIYNMQKFAEEGGFKDTTTETVV